MLNRGTLSLSMTLALATAAGVEAQEARSSEVAATVPSVGEVEAMGPLTAGIRLASGDLFVSGVVTTRHNGPYRLEVRLSVLFSTGGRTHEVRARAATGTLVPLGTSTWVTVAEGPGGTGLVNQVEYLIVWGQGGRRNPGVAVELPLTYRVVAR